jgi:hypothetical protein
MLRRRIFGTKMDEIIGYWGKLHNEEIHNLNTSLNIESRRMNLPKHVARMGENRN